MFSANKTLNKALKAFGKGQFVSCPMCLGFVRPLLVKLLTCKGYILKFHRVFFICGYLIGTSVLLLLLVTEAL